MNEVKLPIETTREGNKITKVCVEDVYKIINRVLDALDDTYNNSIEIGRISQEIELNFEPYILDDDILNHEIYFNSTNDFKKIKDFNISNNNKRINFTFNVSSKYNSESNECHFYYKNKCQNQINSNKLNLIY